MAQGLGWLTIEDLRFNPQGHLLSKDLATYKIPDVSFMPSAIDIRFLEDSGKAGGPYGSKAVGEPPLMYGIGVLFALRHAMRAYRPQGTFPLVTPLTPERVLCQLYAKEMEAIARQISSPTAAEVSVS